MSVKDDLYQAIEIIADSKIANLKFDKTVEAIINSVTNIDTGEYQVYYEGNIFVAFASDLTIEYEKEDAVYLKIPEGDLSKKKIIEGKVSSASISASKKDSLTQVKIYQGPEVSTLYGLDNWLSNEEDYGVRAGVSETLESGQRTLFSKTKEEAPNELFSLYSNKYNHIEISADFKAEFLEGHDYGNYGLEIKFAVARTEENEDGENADSTTPGLYYLDISSFNGQPYDFPSPVPQSVIISYPLNYLTGIESIKLIQKGFDRGEIVNNPYYKDELSNIFVYNLKMRFVEIKDLSISPYYLYISAPFGIDLKNLNVGETLKLEPQFLYYGKDISNHDACKYFWCEENPSITIQNELYNKNFGVGWQLLENNSNDNCLYLPNDAFGIYKKTYKVVAVYNDEIVQSATIDIVNGGITDYYIIRQTQEGESSYLEVIDQNSNIVNDSRDWYIKKPDGTYEQISSDIKLNITPYLTYSSVIFTCAIGNYVLYHSLIQPESDEQIQVIFEGSSLFSYDTLGNLDVALIGEEYKITSNIIWKEGYGTTYELKWLDPNGKQIRQETHFPENSLIEDLRFDGKEISFKIANKFSLEKSANNILTLQVITLNGEIFEFKKELSFIKDGDQGTNGTAYSCIIYPCDENGNIKSAGFYPLEIGKTQYYTAKAYKNGNILPEDSYDVKWSYVKNAPFEKIEGEATTLPIYSLTLNQFNPETAIYSILKAQVEINIDKEFDAELQIANQEVEEAQANYEKDPTEENRIKLDNAIIKASAIKERNDKTISNPYTSTTIVNYNLPIPLANFNFELNSLNNDEYWLPTFVKYSSSGYNPTYVDKIVKFQYNSISWNIESLSPNLCDIYTSYLYDEEGSIIRDENGEAVKDLDSRRLRPANRFMFDEGTAVLIISNPGDLNQVIYSPIVMYLDTYGNEAINGWDGTSIELGENNGTILAPQVGAGVKNNDNTFSGVVMGSVQKGEEFFRGLYGFDKGIGTFGLEAQNGNAWFGPGKMIEITANTGIIRGNAPELTNSTHHMQIDLFDNRTDAKAIHIFKGSNPDTNKSNSTFYITYGGECYLKGEIEATSGKIGNWTISDGNLVAEPLQQGRDNYTNPYLIIKGYNNTSDEIETLLTAGGLGISVKRIDFTRFIKDEEVDAFIGATSDLVTDGQLGLGLYTGDTPLGLYTASGLISLKAGGGQSYMFLRRQEIEIGAGGDEAYNSVHFTLNIKKENQHGIYARFA